ncbi:hypothetical protein BDV93DRAFT_521093 [Ceratobasidium sp. AG-I]|nr:hypothetical protein BDV93DRAFT_521093 [Ceratobasidium sp. AG-I]
MSVRKITRSLGGCLTCKRRKKKCDETKPVCTRCTAGGFVCLGYEDSKSPPKTSRPKKELAVATPESSYSSYSNEEMSIVSEAHSLFNIPVITSEPYTTEIIRPESPFTMHHVREYFAGIPRNMRADPLAFESAFPLIVAQFSRVARRLFQPLPYPIEEGLAWRAHTSEITRWTMYIGAMIMESLFNGDNREHFVGWIDRFHGQIVGFQPSRELDVVDLNARLSGLRDLLVFATMVSNTQKGYSLFKRGTPIFLQLAVKYPQLWTPTSSISISRALYFSKHYEIRPFVLFDTITALALGTAPLLHYDTTRHPPEQNESNRVLEWVYGCPPDIIILLAKVNSWRVARWIDPAAVDGNEWREVEGLVNAWRPDIEPVDGSTNLVARMAIQECWRQTVFIYMYMAMCEVTSEDPRVQRAARQIVQMAGTIQSGDQLELHLFIPCLVAGIAARQEAHRAFIRKKILTSRNEKTWVLRGADFAPVLDHLWHGAAARGCPSTWEDYVSSRCAILPIEV